MKEKEQKQARKLRSQGHSLREISEELEVSESSVSTWVRDVELDDQAQRRIEKLREQAIEKARRTKRLKREREYEKATEKAQKTLNNFTESSENSKIICALIYWCEGASNRDGRVNFTNSEPELVQLFLYLLRNSFDVDEDKFRAVMHLHDYHDEGKQKRFWSEVTSIPESQFHKTYQKEHTKKQTREGYPGCVSVRYHDVSITRELSALAKYFAQEIKGP